MQGKDGMVWHDPKTPKICGTCVHAAQIGDGNWICLKRTLVRDKNGNPFMVQVIVYANAAQCYFWEKGGELTDPNQKAELPELTDKELAALRRKR